MRQDVDRKNPGMGADIAAAGLGAAAAGVQAIPVFGQIAGAVLGIGAGLAKMFGNKKRKKAAAAAREKARLNRPKFAAENMTTGGPGQHTPGLNPVTQSGVTSSAPTIVQGAATSAGQIKRAGTPASLNAAKQNYLFRVAMNNKG